MTSDTETKIAKRVARYEALANEWQPRPDCIPEHNEEIGRILLVSQFAIGGSYWFETFEDAADFNCHTHDDPDAYPPVAVYDLDTGEQLEFTVRRAARMRITGAA